MGKGVIFCRTVFLGCMFFSLFLLSGCEADIQERQDGGEPLATAASSGITAGSVDTERGVVTSSQPSVYADDEPDFSFVSPDGATLEERILTPQGFVRTDMEEDGFGRFVRDFPMEPDGSPILLYDGQLKSRQEVGIATFSLPVISSADLQQCADSVMRMYAEYFWHSGQFDKIRFHFVNGFLFDYPTYRDGKRVRFDGDTANWHNLAAFDDSYEAFEDYLYFTFAYSSTLSMEGESVPAFLSDVRIGDIFLKSGSPGHVVMVADVCEDKDGRKAFLLAQSYMPAQQFYVLDNPANENDPWYYVDEITYPLSTPEYTFQEGSFRRLTYLD